MVFLNLNIIIHIIQPIESKKLLLLQTFLILWEKEGKCSEKMFWIIYPLRDIQFCRSSDNQRCVIWFSFLKRLRKWIILKNLAYLKQYISCNAHQESLPLSFKDSWRVFRLMDWGEIKHGHILFVIVIHGEIVVRQLVFCREIGRILSKSQQSAVIDVVSWKKLENIFAILWFIKIGILKKKKIQQNNTFLKIPKHIKTFNIEDVQKYIGYYCIPSKYTRYN